jgi:HD superfamily phosphohydrolase
MNLWGIYHKDIPDFLQLLSQTDAMQRLGDVGMNCGCEYTAFDRFSRLQPYSRLDHSMGVALIVWHFTADKAQSAAGLLHDIATPVFAHTVDFLNGDHLKQESTESATEKMILADPQLRKILQENGIDAQQVTDYHQYPIADNDAPGLAADRLEYTLGNGVNYGFITYQQAKALYDDLVVGINEKQQQELMFTSRERALEFAVLALCCSKVYVSDEDRYTMQALAQLLKDALDAGILTEKDLYTRETPVIEKLKASCLAPRWQQFCTCRQLMYSDKPENGEGWYQIPAKKRYIDPYIRDTGRVSTLEPAFAAEMAAFLEQPQTVWLKGV